MKGSGKTRIQEFKETFTVDYPEALEFMDQQASIFWPHYEVKVWKDKHDIIVNMTESERHGTVSNLQLFTQYEKIIGDEFWLNFVMKKFPRAGDIQPMAAMFGAIELSVHQMFYKRLNDEIGLDTDEFYNAWKDNPVLAQRIRFLEETLSSEDDLEALGAFTFGEGAILYSAFAYLKHFQSNGKNKILNVVSGINFSARDEALHAKAAAWLFRTLLKEKLALGVISEYDVSILKQKIEYASEIVLAHERDLNRETFSKGLVDGITEKQLNNFAASRVDLCLSDLGFDRIYNPEYNPIASWFYKGINGYQSTDFFNSQGNQYTRDWHLESFIWGQHKGDNV